MLRDTTEHQAERDSALAANEGGILYPTYAHWSESAGEWIVEVTGTLFRSRARFLQRQMLIRVLQRLMRVSVQPADNPFFAERVHSFLQETVAGRTVRIRVGELETTLEQPTQADGHFRGRVRLRPADGGVPGCGDASNDPNQPPEQFLPLRLLLPSDDDRQIRGTAQLIPPTGLSVVSDIDDTIKHSDVFDHRRLLRNTFLREFEPVPGMAAWYQEWAAQGAAFHYVSSSPWPLFSCLNRLLEQHGFPFGSIHLRGMRLRQASILRMLRAGVPSKRIVIQHLLKTFPGRRFVLVGDSGERDPEIYGELARQFPRQIGWILIRRVQGRSCSSERMQRAFRDVPRDRWQLFAEPTEPLASRLSQSSTQP